MIYNKNIANELIEYSIKELSNNNLDNAFRSIYAYLSLFDKNEYEFLVINLIKLDLINKDYGFNRLINILNNLSNDYYFDENYYIKCLYESLKENKVKESEIYLDIVSKRNKELRKIEFKTKEEKYQYYHQLAISRINTAASILGTNYSEILNIIKKNNLSFSVFDLGNLVVTNPSEFIKLVNGEYLKTKKTSINPHQKIIEAKIAELKQGKGFVILGKMNNEEINSIKEVIRKIPDVAYFTVGTNNIKTVALKHRIPRSKQSCNLKKLINEAKVAYDSGDYEKSINLQKEILAIGKPRATTFVKIGLAYMKQFKTKSAIKYLSMATELSIQEKGNYDFTDLIDALSKRNKDEQKNFLTKKIKMTEQDFVQEENFGIINFKEIETLIVSGMSITDACLKFNLNEEQINIVKLIFARKCYSNEDYITGDNIIKHVERSKNKTSLVIQLINEIRKNKKFYKNRVNEEDFVLKKI